MNIDFPPPSNGVYNNAGSSRQLAAYMEHEDLQRMKQGVYTEGFFNLNQDNLYKSQAVKDIDGNIGQLLKTDAKFYAVHVSPSEKELQAMGSTEQEQAEAMRRYIREIFIPEYAMNFNKGLSAEDIKFYGKIHFSRDSSENRLNMHCHLIVSRKDQSNKVKISPLTNHRDTRKGAIKGGFDRINLFRQAEQGFDKLFGYNRSLTESFEYYNTMKNGSISDQLKMQKQQISDERKMNISMQTVMYADKKTNVSESKFANKHEANISNNTGNKQDNKQSFKQSDWGLSSVLGILSPELGNSNEEQPLKLLKKKKKRKRGLRR